ncbi:oligosaccharide flippase family protein [Patescibacteria group bacterium]|nr:oligosaccharide flippase family protein [Patescibacteria group bacterium]
MNNPRIFFNTFSQAVSRFLVIVVSFLTTAFLTRKFGSEGYGNYVFLTSFVLIFVGLSDMGTTTISIRESSVHREKIKETFNNLLGLRLFLSLIAVLILNLLVIFLPQFSNLRLEAIIASSVIVFLILRTTTQAVFQTYFRLDTASLLEIISSFVFLLAIYFSFQLFNTYSSLLLLMIFWSFSALVSGVAGLFLVKKYFSLQIEIDREKIKKLLKESFPLGIYLLVYSVYDRGIDSFIIKSFSGSSAVGFYGLAYKIHGNLILGAAFLMNSLFPYLSSLKDKGTKIKETFRKAYTILFVSGITILFFGLFLSPFIIKIVGGEGFSPAINALRILLWATFFSYLNHLNGYLMVAIGKQDKLLSFSLISLLVNLILNLIFVPKFSFLAAAFVTVITEATILLLTSLYLSNNYGLKYSLSLLKLSVKEFLIKKQQFFTE